MTSNLRRLVIQLISMTALSVLLAACGGVPVSTMAYFVTRGAKLLEGDPAVMAVAIQHDSHMQLTEEAAPYLRIRIVPKVRGAFREVDERLPLALVSQEPETYGLLVAETGWRWRIYALSPQQVTRMRTIQSDFRALRNNPTTRDAGGSLSIDVGMESMAQGDARISDASRIESWLRMSVGDGFRKLWSGTVGELRAAAKQAGGRSG